MIIIIHLLMFSNLAEQKIAKFLLQYDITEESVYIRLFHKT